MCENLIKSKTTIEEFNKWAEDLVDIMFSIEAANEAFRREFSGVMGLFIK